MTYEQKSAILKKLCRSVVPRLKLSFNKFELKSTMLTSEKIIISNLEDFRNIVNEEFDILIQLDKEIS